jgi:hypothetical protein
VIVSRESITVRCFRCGVENTRRYVVTDACSAPARLSYAHAYLRTLGWVCDGRGVFCPLHVPVASS